MISAFIDALHLNRLRWKHRKALKLYENGDFRDKNPSITYVNALNQCLIKTNVQYYDYLCFYLPFLEEHVLSSWYEDHTQKRTDFPFEALIEIANNTGKLEQLKWIFHLEKNNTTIQWHPLVLLIRYQKIGEWSLQTFKFEYSTQHASFIKCILHSAFVWQCVIDYKYALKIFEVLLNDPFWTWENRWIQLIAPHIHIHIKPNIQNNITRTLYKQHALKNEIIAAMFHQESLEFQKIACALKNTTHPKETSLDGDPQLIRYHFFDGPPPKSKSNALLSTLVGLQNPNNHENGALLILRGMFMENMPETLCELSIPTLVFDE